MATAGECENRYNRQMRGYESDSARAKQSGRQRGQNSVIRYLINRPTEFKGIAWDMVSINKTFAYLEIRCRAWRRRHHLWPLEIRLVTGVKPHYNLLFNLITSTTSLELRPGIPCTKRFSHDFYHSGSWIRNHL